MEKLPPQLDRHGRIAAAALAVALLLTAAAPRAAAQDVSAEPFLQVFESRWDVIEDRMADIFVAGYGRLWLPPPQRADSGGLSVGYDVFDRFDLGSPRNETLYGTETGLKTLVDQAHQAGIRVNTDFIINHNGFSDNNTFDGQGTVTPADDVTFEQSGGYPGFLSSAPGLPDGDFHFQQSIGDSEQQGRLAGLIDINHSLNLQFIRTPVNDGDPLNIPAGTQGIFGRPPTNVPDPGNARFYQDRDLGGTVVTDPRFGNQQVTLFDFNEADPLQGDPVTENALGLILRSARWMIQEIGVDGFRLDAVRHFHPEDPSQHFVMDFFDQAVFRASRRTLLDGSPDHAFSFSETGGDNRLDYLQSFIRKDIDNNNLGQVGGNRDNLDFNLFFAIKDNLTDNGLQNDWRNIKNVSIDAHDDGFANNGSQGVAFARSHDDGPSALDNVAHAYLLMRPGNVNLYLNGKQFGEGRDFPQDGRGDALGGVYGDAITTLVGVRNSHGRGNYLDRTPGGSEKELLIYERENSALVLLNNRLDAGFDERTVQTGFAPGTPLVELTGNADDGFIDPNDDLANMVIVGPTGEVTVRVPRNRSLPVGATEENDHRSGYLIYGVARPEGRMLLTDSAGQPLTNVLAGSTPTPGQGGEEGPSDDFFNGITRLTDITVVTEDSFRLRVETDSVTLPGGIRDIHADGDQAQFRINGGLDGNGNGVVDNVTPGGVSYGFEEFTGVRSPGFGSGQLPDGGGAGLYEQTIDTTQLAEGRHFLTGRVFRHRDPGSNAGDPSTNGDGGPAVFTDFRQVIYVDRLEPESEFASFEPFASDPDNPNDRDLIARSTDGTADNMHIFLNLPAAMTDQQVLQMALNGVNDAGEYDRDEWIFGFTDVTSGNHVVTVVTFEPTGTSSVRRFAGEAGLSVQTDLGAGLGDLDADGVFDIADVAGLEAVIASDNALFNPAADVTADGLVDTRDLLAMGDELILGGAGSAVLDEYGDALLRRADLNNDGVTDAGDLGALYANLGSADAVFDINLDGTTDTADAMSLVFDLARSVAGDFNLDGVVDAADYTLHRAALLSGDRTADADFDGDVDANDLAAWAAAFGTTRVPFSATATASALGVGAQPAASSPAVTPEPGALTLLVLAAAGATAARRRR